MKRHRRGILMPANLQMRLTDTREPLVVLSFSLQPVAALSPAELEVARLASAGLSNEDIARFRGTSARTVASQMARIFTKLRIGTRRALSTIPELRA
jgi:DNA-binding CsgD family transcriptional regulator